MPQPPHALDQLRVDGCYLVDPANQAYLNLGFLATEDDASATTASPATQAFGVQLAGAFEDACSNCEIRGGLIGGPRDWQIVFEGQEGASAELVLQAFHDEARAAGLLPGETLRIHPAMTQADVDLAEQRLRSVAQRLRTLLIEHNSYLSGGLRYPFPAALEGVAERGLAIYRFPRLGEVDVVAEDASVRITFAPAELGEVTSSGFYLPTLFGGDFTVEASYRLDQWRPCPEEAACFALFAQNEASSYRYYAQRMSTGDQAHRLLASLAEVLSPEQDVPDPDSPEPAGRFRIQRHGDTIHCWHRATDPDAQWLQLGSAEAPVENEMLIGAKIWSKIRCDGLQARITDLRIQGRMAERQIPPVPVRSDPRSNSQGES